ncbi:MAG: HEAT repeat domain-containing protein [Helicobacteraceae bacterium]
MDAKEFLDKMSALPSSGRISFSKNITDLTKLAVVEAAAGLLKFKEEPVRINALKAIRQHGLDNFEKEIIAMLVDNSAEVKLSAIKTLASFGKREHFALVKTYYAENRAAQEAMIDVFVNYSDYYPAYEFMLGELTSPLPKVKQAAADWFRKAFKRDILLPWILESYKNSPFSAKRLFETEFNAFLPKIFGDETYGYRLKLAFITGRQNGLS